MLELYILETCPYCKRVMDYFDENKIKYKVHDISNKSELDDLILIGGKEQVPYLYDHENHIGIYESETIIKYANTVKCRNKKELSD